MIFMGLDPIGRKQELIQRLKRFRGEEASKPVVAPQYFSPNEADDNVDAVAGSSTDAPDVNQGLIAVPHATAQRCRGSEVLAADMNQATPSTDISFANFVALDFNQQFDLVAAHHQADHATEALQSPSGREREEPATKRHRSSLDDPDGDAAIETESEAGFGLPALFSQAAAAPRATQLDTAQDVEVVRRRITGKRAADGTDFPARSLI